MELLKINSHDFEDKDAVASKLGDLLQSSRRERLQLVILN